MKRVPCLALALLLAVPSARADFVVGCALQDGKMPHVLLRLLDDQLQELAVFDTAVDAQWAMPSSIQLPLPDASMYVEYVADDLREMYGNLQQSLSVQFADLLPSKSARKHPAGRADNIAIGGMEPVVGWIGTATFFTISGIVTDGILTPPCQWFCQIDIEWQASSVAVGSFGAVKALY